MRLVYAEGCFLEVQFRDGKQSRPITNTFTEGNMADPVIRHRVLNAQELLMVKDDPNRWLVSNMIPKQGITLLFGQEGHYKSTLIFDLCIAMCSGGNLLGHYPVALPGPVLLNSTEGSTYDNKERLLLHARAHNVNFAELPLHFCQQPFCMDDQLDVDELEYHLKEIKPIMVVMDPLDSFFMGDENSAKDTKLVRRAIDRLKEQYSCAFVILHHMAKDKKAGATTRGSSAWPGWADAVIHVNMERLRIGLPDPVDTVKVESKKQRNGKAGHLFSFVPHIDTVRRLTTFSLYDGKDFTNITLEHYKQKAYEALKASKDCKTASMLAEQLNLRPEKVSEALSLLEKQGLAARDGTVVRPYGTQGKTRRIAAWRPLGHYTVADLAEIMIKEQVRSAENKLSGYDTLRESPDEERFDIAFKTGTLHAYPQNSGRIRAPGNGQGSELQSFCN